MVVPESRRFTVQVKLNRAELEALQRLSEAERLPAAQVLRRLIWLSAKQIAEEAATCST